MQTELTTAAHLLLLRWASWQRSSSNLGYPKRSVEQRAREGGYSTKHEDLDMPECIEITDIALTKVKQHCHTWYQAITLPYLAEEWTDAAVARKLGITTNKAKKLRARAEGYFMGLIDAAEVIRN